MSAVFLLIPQKVINTSLHFLRARRDVVLALVVSKEHNICAQNSKELLSYAKHTAFSPHLHRGLVLSCSGMMNLNMCIQEVEKKKQRVILFSSSTLAICLRRRSY